MTPPCPNPPANRLQDHITEAELAELEAVDDWVALQAGIEEWETEFLIDLALE